MGLSTERKREYGEKLRRLVAEYGRCLIVGCDNIGSKHIQNIRQLLRGRAELLFGKNTMIRRVLRDYSDEHPEVLSLIDRIYGNVGFVFTKEDFAEIKEILDSHKVGANAKAGLLAPSDVHIPAGPTGLPPTQTSFLQALNIASKINKGQIEITNSVHLIVKGTKVGSSEAALLQKLNICPFEYKLDTLAVFDEGQTYDAELMSLGADHVMQKFAVGVSNVAALSLAIHFPTIASLPHIIVNGFKNVLHLSLATDYTISAAKELKEILENPEAFLAALPTQAAPDVAKTEAPAAAAAAAAPEPEEEEEEEEVFSLFD